MPHPLPKIIVNEELASFFLEIFLCLPTSPAAAAPITKPAGYVSNVRLCSGITPPIRVYL